MEKYSGLIEAMLYYENEIISLESIKKKTGLEEDKIREIIEKLIDDYSKKNHGITITEVAGGFTFQIKQEIFHDIKDLYNIKEKGNISKSVMTVLSIIAYKQPITKMEIEEIRGVSPDSAVRTLLEKNLIEIKGRKEVLGRPLMYGTTQQFLKYFNLKNIGDLPTLNELKSEEFQPESF